MGVSSFFAFTRRAEEAYQLMSGPLCQQFGLAGTAFDILMFLGNNPQCNTARQISQLRHIRPNVVSLHVDRLVRQGFLLRESVAGDRRKIRLLCTPKADRLIAAGLAMQKTFYQRMTQGLTDPDRACVRHCFQVISANAQALSQEKIQVAEET